MNGMLQHSSKSEVLLVGSMHQLSKLTKIGHVDVAEVSVPCKYSIILLGFTIIDFLSTLLCIITLKQ